MDETNQSPTFEEQLTELAQVRQEYDETRQAMEKLVSDIVQSVPYQALLTCNQKVKARAAELEKDIRDMGVINYLHSGEKKPAAGVTVKVFTIKSINYDKDQARKWVLEHAPLLVKIDFAGFEKHAEAVSQTIPLDFVTIITEEEPRTEIGKDLSKYLPPAPVPQPAPVAVEEVPLPF